MKVLDQRVCSVTSQPQPKLVWNERWNWDLFSLHSTRWLLDCWLLWIDNFFSASQPTVLVLFYLPSLHTRSKGGWFSGFLETATQKTLRASLLSSGNPRLSIAPEELQREGKRSSVRPRVLYFYSSSWVSFSPPPLNLTSSFLCWNLRFKSILLDRDPANQGPGISRSHLEDKQFFELEVDAQKTELSGVRTKVSTFKLSPEASSHETFFSKVPTLDLKREAFLLSGWKRIYKRRRLESNFSSPPLSLHPLSLFPSVSHHTLSSITSHYLLNIQTTPLKLQHAVQISHRLSSLRLFHRRFSCRRRRWCQWIGRSSNLGRASWLRVWKWWQVRKD